MHMNTRLFIVLIRKAVDTIHDISRQIHSGMLPRKKRAKTRTAGRRIDELYDRFQYKRITERELLRELSLFVAHKK